LNCRFPVCLFWILTLADVSAQVPQFQFQRLGKEEGLSNNTGNHFISEDSRGFIWISSLNGFYRFDGVKLKHFLIPQNAEDDFIPNQQIQSEFREDQHGNLWFTTYNSLHCFNRESSAISNFQAPDREGQKPDQSYFLFHMESNAGRLWLRAGDHVWVYDIATGRWEKKFPDTGVRFCVAADASGAVTTVISCGWIKGPVTVSRKKAGGNWVSENYLDPDLEIRSALLNTDSTAWLFSDRGLLEFNFISGALDKQYTHTDDRIKLDLFGGVYLQERRLLLLATRSNGIVAFDLQKKRFAGNWKQTSGNASSLSGNAPRALFLSKAGQLWVGHWQGGVDFSRFSYEGFSNPLQADAGVSAKVISLLEDRQKNIWLLTKEGGIYRSAGGKAPLKSVPPPPVQELPILLAADELGAIWAITKSSVYHLKAYDGAAKNKWEHVLSSEFGFVSIFCGIPGRTLLITKKGVFDLVKQDGKYELQPSGEFKDYPGFYFIHFYKINEEITLIPFESNDLWIARIEGDSLVISEKLEIEGNTYGASSSGDSLWIGANTGLMLYHKGKVVQMLKSAEDLAASLHGIFKTDHNHLWMSTGFGLLKYQINPQQLTGFYQRDGLSNDQFAQFAHLKASDGRLWLGNEEGLTVFHPDSIRGNSPAARVHVESFWVNNAPFETPKVISETDKLQLAYWENTLAFELRAISFHHAESNLLKYRLLGYDDSWATVPNGGYARFTNIPPGRYTLEILPLNANGQMGAKHSLSVYIQPPFWQTLWFKISSVLVALLLVAAVVGAYYQRKLRKQKLLLERQQALNEERNRIAKELHDDMGSSLSSIIFLSEDLLQEENASEKQELQRIFTLAESSLENMREIIWAMDTGKNTLQDLSIRLQAFAKELLTDNKVPFELDFPGAPLSGYVLGGESRRNTYLIAKEALHNTIKHAKASLVKVSLKLAEQQIVLEIQDDGLGFDEHALTSSGHGLNNMQGRAKAINGLLEIRSNPGKGTLLRLSVPL